MQVLSGKQQLQLLLTAMREKLKQGQTGLLKGINQMKA